MARKKRKIPGRTAEEQARWDQTTRLLEERIAFHPEVSRLLREREREQEVLRRLREQSS